MCLQYPLLSCNAQRNLPSVGLHLGEAAQWENIYLWRALLGEETAINRYNVPGDVTGIFRCQKGGWPGKIFRFAHASKRYGYASLPLYLRIHTLRINRTRNEGIHANTVRGKVECHGPGKGLYAAF